MRPWHTNAIVPANHGGDTQTRPYRGTPRVEATTFQAKHAPKWHMHCATAPSAGVLDTHVECLNVCTEHSERHIPMRTWDIKMHHLLWGAFLILQADTGADNPPVEGCIRHPPTTLPTPPPLAATESGKDYFLVLPDCSTLHAAQ